MNNSNNNIFKAISFAAEKHKQQVRKGTKSPYINHPIELVYLITNVGCVYDSNTLSIAVLHDTIEDTNTTFEELVQEFSFEIAQGVLDCSDDKSLPKSIRKKYQIEHSMDKSKNVQIVKIADKISNIKGISQNPPSDWSKERTISFLVWSLKVVESIKESNILLFNYFCEVYEQEMENLYPNFREYPIEIEKYLEFQLNGIDKTNQLD